MQFAMPVKIRLPWKGEIPWAEQYNTKCLLNKSEEKSPRPPQHPLPPPPPRNTHTNPHTAG